MARQIIPSITSIKHTLFIFLFIALLCDGFILSVQSLSTHAPKSAQNHDIIDASKAVGESALLKQRKATQIPDGLLFVSTLDGQLHALDVRTGAYQWNFGTGSSLLQSTPAASLVNNHLNDIDVKDGSSFDPWAPLANDDAGSFHGNDDESETEDDSSVAANLLIPGVDGQLFFTTRQGGVERLPVKIGELVSASPFRSVDDRLYVGKKSSVLFLIDRRTGHVHRVLSSDRFDDLTQQCTGDDCDEAGDISVSNEWLLWLGKQDLSVHAFDVRQHRKWNVSVAEWVVDGSEVVLSESQLAAIGLPHIAATVDGVLYAIKDVDERARPLWLHAFTSPISNVYFARNPSRSSRRSSMAEQLLSSSDMVKLPLFYLPVPGSTADPNVASLPLVQQYVYVRHKASKSGSLDTYIGQTPEGVLYALPNPVQSDDNSIAALFPDGPNFLPPTYLPGPDSDATSSPGKSVVAIDSTLPTCPSSHPHWPHCFVGSHAIPAYSELNTPLGLPGLPWPASLNLSQMPSSRQPIVQTHGDEFYESSDPDRIVYQPQSMWQTVLTSAVVSVIMIVPIVFFLQHHNNKQTQKPSKKKKNKSSNQTIANPQHVDTPVQIPTVELSSPDSSFDEISPKSQPQLVSSPGLESMTEESAINHTIDQSNKQSTNQIHKELQVSDDEQKEFSHSHPHPAVTSSSDPRSSSSIDTHHQIVLPNNDSLSSTTSHSNVADSQHMLTSSDDPSSHPSKPSSSPRPISKNVKPHLQSPLLSRSNPSDNSSSADSASSSSSFSAASPTNSDGSMAIGSSFGPPVDVSFTSVFTSNKQVYTIGKIQIFGDQILGTGSCGTVVFAGLHETRECAVKRLMKPFFGQENANKEIALLIQSDQHSSVLRYYAREEDASFIYIALEKCAGSLQDLIEGSTPSLKQIWAGANRKTILHSMMSGLAHLHSLNIVHRDLKPANILLTASHLCKLADMGLGKQLSLSRSSFDSVVSRSFGWQPPEVLQHSGARLTKAVDIFSAGCVIYYVLTEGQHPFGANVEREVNIMHQKCSFSHLTRNIDEAEDLLSSMLNNRADDRMSAQDCVNHPFFWSDEIKLHFLCDASDRVEAEPEKSECRLTLERFAPAVLDEEPWDTTLHQGLIDNLGKFRKYDYHSLRDLLRVIRNKRHHYRDLPADVQSTLGPLPSGFLNYFTTKWPKLFMYVYQVMACFCVDSGDSPMLYSATLPVNMSDEVLINGTSSLSTPLNQWPGLELVTSFRHYYEHISMKRLLALQAPVRLRYRPWSNDAQSFVEGSLNQISDRGVILTPRFGEFITHHNELWNETQQELNKIERIERTRERRAEQPIPQKHDFPQLAHQPSSSYVTPSTPTRPSPQQPSASPAASSTSSPRPHLSAAATAPRNWSALMSQPTTSPSLRSTPTSQSVQGLSIGSVTSHSSHAPRIGNVHLIRSKKADAW